MPTTSPGSSGAVLLLGHDPGGTGARTSPPHLRLERHCLQAENPNTEPVLPDSSLIPFSCPPCPQE